MAGNAAVASCPDGVWRSVATYPQHKGGLHKSATCPAPPRCLPRLCGWSQGSTFMRLRERIFDFGWLVMWGGSVRGLMFGVWNYGAYRWMRSGHSAGGVGGFLGVSTGGMHTTNRPVNFGSNQQTFGDSQVPWIWSTQCGGGD
jgi:hypothetical protein